MSLTNEKKNIVIFGATGFIGGNILKKLLKPENSADGSSCIALPSVNLCAADASDYLSDFIPLGSTVIITAGIKRQIDDSIDSIHRNLLIIVRLCKTLSRRDVKKVIYLSSAAVYGEDCQWTRITEENPLLPSSYYGIAKRSSEEILLKVSSDYGIESTIIFRPTLVYGLGDKSNAYGPTGFLVAARENRPITLWGDGSELRDFVFVDDVASIILHFLRLDISGVFNLCTGKSRSFIEIVRVLQRDFPKLDFVSRERSRPKVDQIYSSAKLRSLLPAEFIFTSLEDGLSAMVTEGGIR
jgi:nucleoside-diphosphate-sugar epimerase